MNVNTYSPVTPNINVQHAVEIVKNLQRLQGIDGDYDNDSGSGPDRIARRRTILNLDKAAKPRRQIGTLDVAFKKRFLQLTADENNPSKKRETLKTTFASFDNSFFQSWNGDDHGLHNKFDCFLFSKHFRNANINATFNDETRNNTRT